MFIKIFFLIFSSEDILAKIKLINGTIILGMSYIYIFYHYKFFLFIKKYPYNLVDIRHLERKKIIEKFNTFYFFRLKRLKNIKNILINKKIMINKSI